MTDTLDLNLPEADAGDDGDNITDWCLQQFQTQYGPQITKDDIWEYLYGVMHAPDWREHYRHDLQRNLARVPLAADFEEFRAAGRQLMNLHIGYQNLDEWPVACLVDGQIDDGDAEDSAYRIEGKMRWGKHPDASEDRSVLRVNSRCQLVGIPAEAEEYKISGRSPLQWAIASLQVKTDSDSRIVNDANLWHEWCDESFNLIRHLRRLVRVSVETGQIVASLPPSLQDDDAVDHVNDG